MVQLQNNFGMKDNTGYITAANRVRERLLLRTIPIRTTAAVFIIALLLSIINTSFAFSSASSTRSLSYPSTTPIREQSSSTSLHFFTSEGQRSPTNSAFFYSNINDCSRSQSSIALLNTKMSEESKNRIDTDKESTKKQKHGLILSLRDCFIDSNSGECAAITTTPTSDDSNKIQFVLGSKSPRRKEILDMMGLQNKYITIPSPFDESIVQQKYQNENPVDYTRLLAEHKALAVAELMVKQRVNDSGNDTASPPTLILGSDTIVALGNKKLEKPTSKEDAVRMLLVLQNNTHTVHTGVAIVSVMNGSDTASGVVVTSFTATADVTFGVITEEDIRCYVDTNEPMDKAGAYGIQGIGGQLIDTIRGDFFTVMGLPMRQTSTSLATIVQSILNT